MASILVRPLCPSIDRLRDTTTIRFARIRSSGRKIVCVRLAGEGGRATIGTAARNAAEEMGHCRKLPAVLGAGCMIFNYFEKHS